MRRTIVVFAMLLGSLWLLAGCTAVPAIVAEPLQLDFGDIPADRLAIATLQVRNAGKAPLQIGDLRTSCGCTQASISQNSVEGGDQAELTVVFDPQAHPGLYGPLLRLVYIQSNDPTTPELEIPILVNVLAPDEALR
jgi:hypothetical protein